MNPDDEKRAVMDAVDAFNRAAREAHDAGLEVIAEIAESPIERRPCLAATVVKRVRVEA